MVIRNLFICFSLIAVMLGCSSSGNDYPPSTTCGTSCKDGKGAPGTGNNINEFIDNLEGVDAAEVDQGVREVALLNHLVNNNINTYMKIMDENITVMSSKVEQACMGDAEVLVEDLRSYLKLTVGAFHRVEPFIFGPLFTDDPTKYGANNPYRKFLFSHEIPTKQAGFLESEIQFATFDKEDYDPNVSTANLGFDALAFHFFVVLKDKEKLTSAEDSCWHLKFIQKDLKTRWTTLNTLWNKEVIEPLKSPDGLTKAKVYLTQINQGLIDFVDKILKDARLKAPLGLSSGASDAFPCTVNVDCHERYLIHQFMGNTAQVSFINSIQAIERAFGKEEAALNGDFGINAFIKAGKNDLSKSSQSLASRELSAKWQGLPSGDKFVEMVKNFNKDETDTDLAQAYDLVLQLSDYMKGEFLVDMSVKIPDSVGGDND